MEKFKKGDIVYVVWNDSSSHTGWTFPPFTLEIGTIRSAGLVVETTPGQITITNGINDEGACLSPLAIPLAAIKEIRKLEVPLEDR